MSVRRDSERNTSGASPEDRGIFFTSIPNAWPVVAHNKVAAPARATCNAVFFSRSIVPS
jgi:hypothetical protein